MQRSQQRCQDPWPRTLLRMRAAPVVRHPAAAGGPTVTVASFAGSAKRWAAAASADGGCWHASIPITWRGALSPCGRFSLRRAHAERVSGA